MKQDSVIRFQSEDKKILILCEVDTSLGLLHDNLMILKELIIKKMVEIQEQEKKKKEEAEAALKASTAEPEPSKQGE
jgi:DNA primase catalytic subunit